MKIKIGKFPKFGSQKIDIQLDPWDCVAPALKVKVIKPPASASYKKIGVFKK